MHNILTSCACAESIIQHLSSLYMHGSDESEAMDAEDVKQEDAGAQIAGSIDWYAAETEEKAVTGEKAAHGQLT